MEGEIPDDASVAVAHPRNDFYLWRWSAYFLARHDVLDRAESAKYLIAVGEPPLSGTRIAGGPRCGLYTAGSTQGR